MMRAHYSRAHYSRVHYSVFACTDNHTVSDAALAAVMCHAVCHVTYDANAPDRIARLLCAMHNNGTGAAHATNSGDTAQAYTSNATTMAEAQHRSAPCVSESRPVYMWSEHTLKKAWSTHTRLSGCLTPSTHAGAANKAPLAPTQMDFFSPHFTLDFPKFTVMSRA